MARLHIVGLLGSAIAVGCGQGHARAVATPAAPNPAAILWRYEVRASGADARDLQIEAEFAAGGRDRVEIDEDGAPFVHDLQYASGGAWWPVGDTGSQFLVQCAQGCRIRYRFALREAAEHLKSVEGALAAGRVISSPPSTWLFRDERRVGRFRLHVTVPATTRFAIAIPPSPDGAPDTYEAAADDLEGAGFAVFGAFDSQTVQSGAARVDVIIAPQDMKLTGAEVATWVETAVNGISRYLGKFPARRTLVVVEEGEPGSPTRGETLGDGGPSVLVRVGPDVTAPRLRDDWVMTHELLHVSMPSLGREHDWMSEGLATYVEPIVRARQGLVTPEAFWHDLIEGVSQGLPEPGDEGLDRTHTWGRTYWGGALFYLVADVKIREESHGAKSLDDALRGVVASGADVEEHWSVDQFVEAADRGAGTHVLSALYRAWALAPVSVDLPALWQRLGVRIVARGEAGFDEGAPLASLRRAITARESNPRER
jgi:hypothetical protein